MIDELRIVVNEFDADAARSNLDRPSALRRMRENSDPFVRDQAIRMSDRITRLGRLERQQRAFGGGGLFTQIVFLGSYDSQLAQRTWDNYKAGWNVEGLLLGAFSGIISFLLAILLSSVFAGRRGEYA